MGGGIGSILYRATDNALTNNEFFTYNAVGHTVALTDGHGVETKTDYYEAFGNTVSSTGNSDNNRLANTKERDFSIGLDNHGFRYFETETGRYLTLDPIGYKDGLNRYLCVHNNPINHVDPLGLEETPNAASARAQLSEDPAVAATIQHYKGAAVVGAGIAEAAVGLNPVVSGAEAITGKSAAGIRKLKWWERGLSAAGAVAPATKAAKGVKATKEIADAANTTKKAEEAIDVARIARAFGRIQPIREGS